MVLLIAPIYNADGNERVSLTNRGPQNGPIGGMGTRANAQGLNINRDNIKLDTPEARSMVKLLNDYDPHIMCTFVSPRAFQDFRTSSSL